MSESAIWVDDIDMQQSAHFTNHILKYIWSHCNSPRSTKMLNGSEPHDKMCINNIKGISLSLSHSLAVQFERVDECVHCVWCASANSNC